jgi:hypothetical protein
MPNIIFFSFVSSFWIQTVITGVVSCNLVRMSPKVIIIGRREGLAGAALVALLFDESLDLIQSLRAFFQFFC